MARLALPTQARPVDSLQSPTDLALRTLKDCSTTFPPSPSYLARPAVSLQSPTDLALRTLKDCSTTTFPPTPSYLARPVDSLSVAHRPRLRILSSGIVSASSHQLHPTRLTLRATFRAHRPRLCTPSVPMPPSHQRRCPRGCVKSHFLCWESPPRARMASLQNNFLDFWGLFTQPQGVQGREIRLSLPPLQIMSLT